jgi:hypothetical protein
MQEDWFVWFVVGSMGAFALVLGAVALITRGK